MLKKKKQAIKFENFKFDNNLAFLIQQVTSESSRDILSYFYELANFMAENSIKESNASFLKKSVVLTYKNTPIPYRLDMWSRYRWQEKDIVPIYVDLRFPKENSYLDCTNFANEIAEIGLGLVSEETLAMDKFEKPTFKTPRFLKQLRLEYEKRFKDGDSIKNKNHAKDAEVECHD